MFNSQVESYYNSRATLFISFGLCSLYSSTLFNWLLKNYFLFLGIWFLKSYVGKGSVGCFWNFKLKIDLHSQVLAYQCNNSFLVHFCLLGMTIILLLLFHFISQQLFAIECDVNCNDNHNSRCGCWHLTILLKFNYHSLSIKCEHTKKQCKSWTFILIIGLIEFIILIFFQLWTLDICVYNKIYY